MRDTRVIRHEFIELLPATLEADTLYVSLNYKNMVHLCLCGCGKKVITPLSPTGWELTFNGREVTVYPSIGNWNLPCRSHYWITGNRVEWDDEQWSEERIAAGFARDRADKERFYGREVQWHGRRHGGEPEEVRREQRHGLWATIRDWFL